MASIMFIDVDDVGAAWLTILQRILTEGDDVPTQYDKPGDIPSKDATILVNIKQPFSNPIRNRRIKGNPIMHVTSKFGNKYEVYGVLADLYLIGSIQSGYIEEVLEGVNDKALQESDRSFPYSYHDRIFQYAAFSLEDTIHKDYPINTVSSASIQSHAKLNYVGKVRKENAIEIWNPIEGLEFSLSTDVGVGLNIPNLPALNKDIEQQSDKLLLGRFNLPRINQIEQVIEMLRRDPTTRRAQAITWRPYADPFTTDPPCLQRLFFRIKNNKLLLQTSWRSRDLFKAWEANVNAMIRIQKMVADKLGLETGEYSEFINSGHIYGKDLGEARNLLQQVRKD